MIIWSAVDCCSDLCEAVPMSRPAKNTISRARALRIEHEWAFYHVTSRGNEKRQNRTPSELSIFASRDAPKVSWGDLFIDIQIKSLLYSQTKKEVLID
jgi:hypothetical protein